MLEFNPKRVQGQVRNFERCMASYSFNEPFSRYLTQFYKSNKQMGSSDRRMNSRYCYHFFRLGKALKTLSLQERLVVAEFLCESESAAVAMFQPDWIPRITDDLPSKIAFISSIYGDFLADVFPLLEDLSPAINKEEFIISHFVQPDLYIRLQKGKEDLVKKELDRQGVQYQIIAPQTLALANGTNLQQFRKIDGAYEVQDLSSQQTLEGVEIAPKSSWWDCCAASGGKSLLLLDKEPDIKLMVSDIRLSILRNLDERFERAGVKTYFRKKILDLSTPVENLMSGEAFDGILLDAPCSGSGTWGRTPEMLSKIEKSDIDAYADLQKNIASNVIPYLKVGKPLVYITCSVYAQENEEVVNQLAAEFGLEVEEMRTIAGYTKKADSMFVARLKKSS